MHYDHDREAVCSNFVARMPVAAGFDVRFLVYFHAHLYSGRVNTRSIKQTTGIQKLDSDSYLNELGPYPPLDEQRAIAAFLDRETTRIDELIAKKQRLIELLAEKRTALISHAITKGLNPDAPMKDSGIDWLGEIPSHWDVLRLKHLFHFAKGRRAAELTKEFVNTYPGPYPVYSGQTEDGGSLGHIDRDSPFVGLLIIILPNEASQSKRESRIPP